MADFVKINESDSLVDWRTKFNNNVDASIDLKNRLDVLETGGTTDGELIALRSSTALNFTGATADERVENAEQRILANESRIAALEAKDMKILNVQDFGAKGDGVTDDAAAIQAALDAANAAGGAEVYVPDGVYAIKTTLRIHSNTRFRLSPRATIIRAASFITMLVPASGDVDGYEGPHDIEVIGGTWDCNARQFPSNCNAMVFGHCRNITIRDLTVLDVYHFHCIEINSAQNVRILNCHFKGFSYTRASEAIQLDLAKAAEVFGDYGNYDNTPCENVLIAGCVFEDWSRGIGSHASVANVFHTNIRIIGNHFRNMSEHGVFAYQWKHVVIMGNTFDQCRTGIEVRPGVGTDATDSGYTIIQGNVFRNINGTEYGYAIWLNGDPGIEIDNSVVVGNVIDVTTFDAIYVTYARWCVVADNTVRDAGINGIQLDSSIYCSVRGNIIRRSRESGIYLNNSGGNVVQGNVMEDNQQSGAGMGFAGIRVGNNSNYNNIQGNTCRAGTYTDYGINISNTCTGNFVTNNDLYGGGKTANLRDDSTSTVTTAGNRT